MKPPEIRRFYAAHWPTSAASLLSKPDRIKELPIYMQGPGKKVPINPIDAPKSSELRKAMREFEENALEVGVRSGFWRFMQRAARLLEVTGKVDEYEREFHKALARNRD